MEEKKHLKQEQDKKKKKKGRYKTTSRKDYYGDSRTAGEALEKLISRQKLSNKINYEALRKVTQVLCQYLVSLKQTNQSMLNFYIF